MELSNGLPRTRSYSDELPLNGTAANGTTAPHLASLSNCRVLIVDDDVESIKLYKQLLKDAEFETVYMESGNRAMDCYQKARDNGHPFDLVITDLVLRDANMSGVRLAELIRENDGCTKIVFCTGHTDLSVEFPRNALKVVDVWYKPLDDVMQFQRKIEKVLRMPKDVVEERRDEPRTIPTSRLRPKFDVSERLGLMLGVMLMLTLVNTAALAFQVYRSTFSMELLRNVQQYVKATPQRGDGFAAMVPVNKSAHQVLKDGRARITFEVMPDDAGKLQELARERGRTVRVSVN